MGAKSLNLETLEQTSTIKHALHVIVPQQTIDSVFVAAFISQYIALILILSLHFILL